MNVLSFVNISDQIDQCATGEINISDLTYWCGNDSAIIEDKMAHEKTIFYEYE